jgi:hypothetical protein
MTMFVNETNIVDFYSRSSSESIVVVCSLKSIVEEIVAHIDRCLRFVRIYRISMIDLFLFVMNNEMDSIVYVENIMIESLAVCH